jgi:xanthine dehydrogenase YagR molybdenum-binding subunit
MREGNALIGWGMATTTYPANRQPAAAHATFYADGHVVVRSGTQDIGTGTYTVMMQVAADELKMPASRVRFELGDSRFPKAPVSGGSMTVASVSPAVQAACAALRERILDLAQRDPRAGLGAVARADLRFENGVVIAPSGRVRVAELLARGGADQISAAASVKPGDKKERYSMHSFGAQFAEVRVDADLGEIRVARLLGVFDAGRVLNAKTARSQAIGGIVFGLGMALLEQTHIDPEIGRITNANVSEYLMAVHADVPYIDTVLIENSDPVVDPLGARGLGELPTVGVAAAIANAVFHATGKRVRDLPIRVEDVLA